MEGEGHMVKLLHMPSTLMLIGLTSGLLAGPAFQGIGIAAMAVLAALMTFSLGDVPLTGLRAGLKAAPAALVLSFGLHPAILLLTALSMPASLWEGWVILAAVPPAISIVPFTSILKGDVAVSTACTAILYIASIGLTPIMALLLLGVGVSVWSLVTSVLVLILVPLILSRILTISNLRGRLEVPRNLSFAALTFLVGAGNRGVLVAEPSLALHALAGSALVVVASSGAAWVLLGRVGGASRVSLVLFSGYKNSGLAATLALALLQPTAVVAPTMMILFQILWIAFMTRLRGLPRRAAPRRPSREGDPRPSRTDQSRGPGTL